MGRHDRHAAAHCIDWQGKDWTPAIAKRPAPRPRTRTRASPSPRPTNPVRSMRSGTIPGRRHRRLHLRRPALDDGAARDRARDWVEGVPWPRRWAARRRRRRRPAGRGAARPVRDAAVHRLQHERLLPALARHGQAGAGAVPALGAKMPRIFCVNWFRKGADGKFVWPARRTCACCTGCSAVMQGRAEGLARLRHQPALRGPELERPRFQPAQFQQVTSIDPSSGGPNWRCTTNCSASSPTTCRPSWRRARQSIAAADVSQPPADIPERRRRTPTSATPSSANSTSCRRGARAARGDGCGDVDATVRGDRAARAHRRRALAALGARRAGPRVRGRPGVERLPAPAA